MHSQILQNGLNIRIGLYLNMGPIWYIDYDCCAMKEGKLNFGTEIGFL